MSDSDLGIEADYESDFDEAEVIESKQSKLQAKPQSKKHYDDDDDSVHLASDHSSRSKKSSRRSSKSRKSDSSQEFVKPNPKKDSDNEYENSFEEDSEEQEKPAPKKPSYQGFELKHQETGNSGRYPPKVPSRGNGTPLRSSIQSETPTYSVSPLKMIKKNEMLNDRPPRGYGSVKPSSQKSSVRLSKNSTLENLKPKIEVPKKNRQMLEKENKKLRDNLKSLNDKLSHYLETATSELKVKGKKGSRPEREVKLNTDDVNDKRLLIYQQEYKKIKEKYDKINDTNYIIELKDEILKKEKLVTEFEKRIRALEKYQKDRSKKIENFDDKELGDNKLAFLHLQEEYSKVDEQIKAIKGQIDREEEWYRSNQEKETSLLEKLENLKPEENQTQYTNNSAQKKYNELKNNLLNQEKTKSGVVSQLKVQEYSVKSQKESYQKELAEFQKRIKEKTEELKKLRYELDETAMLASSHNMGKLVSLLNRPSSEKGLIDNKDQYDSNDTNSSKGGLFQEDTPTNLSTGQVKAKSEFDLNIKPKFSYPKAEDFKAELPENKKISEKPPIKSKKPKNFLDDDIEEDIPEENEKKPGILQELDASVEKKSVKKEESKKKSIFDELEDGTSHKPQPKVVEVKKRSILEELDSQVKESPKIRQSPKHSPEKPIKSSIFDELEKPSSKSGFRPPNEIKKPSFLEGHEEKTGFTEPTNKKNSQFVRPNPEKQGLFQENEKKNDPFGFNPIKAPADELFARKDSERQESNKKIGLLGELETKKDDNSWGKAENKPFFMEENEKKSDLFGGINAADPNKKRNRAHLAKETDKKEDKIAALASNAANHDFFGGFNDNLESKPGNLNIQSKLLPIRNESSEKKNDFNLFGGNNEGFKKPDLDSGFKGFENNEKKHEPMMDFKKPAVKAEAMKKYDLDEEDLLL